MTDEPDMPGATDLIAAMRELREQFDVTTVAVTQRLRGDQYLTVTVSRDDMVTFETPDHTQVRF